MCTKKGRCWQRQANGLFTPTRGCLVFLLYDGCSLVGAALEADVVREAQRVALRAWNKLLRSQCQMAATPVLSSSRRFAFW